MKFDICNLTYPNFLYIVSKYYHSFFVTASIQNLCGLFEMKD